MTNDSPRARAFAQLDYEKAKLPRLESELAVATAALAASPKNKALKLAVREAARKLTFKRIEVGASERCLRNASGPEQPLP